MCVCVCVCVCVSALSAVSSVCVCVSALSAVSSVCLCECLTHLKRPSLVPTGSVSSGLAPSGHAQYGVVVREAGAIELSAVAAHDPAGKWHESNSWYLWFDDHSDSHSAKWDVSGMTTTMSRYRVPQKFVLEPGVHTLHVGIREAHTRIQSLRIEAGEAAFLGTRGSGGRCPCRCACCRVLLRCVRACALSQQVAN